MSTHDTVVRGGRLVDGTDSPWIRGDLALTDGRIAAVGDFSYVDLDGNQSFDGAIAEVSRDPTLSIDGPGHGIVPDPAVLSDGFA